MERFGIGKVLEKLGFPSGAYFICGAVSRDNLYAFGSVSEFHDYRDSYYFCNSCMFTSFGYKNKDTSRKMFL